MKFSNYNVFRRINGNPYVYNSVTKAFLRVSDTALPFEDLCFCKLVLLYWQH